MPIKDDDWTADPRHGGVPVDPYEEPWPPPYQAPAPPYSGPGPGTVIDAGPGPIGPGGPPPGWGDDKLPDWYNPGTGEVGGDNTGLGDVFEIPGYSGPSAPPGFDFSDVPEFNPSMFNVPSFADAQNEPGFQHRLQSGTDALERSAAARGTLRTGGTLKDIVSYGQNFAAQEYHNVFNRALQAYGANYQREKDMYAPLFAEWQFGANAAHDREMAEFQRAWDEYELSVQAALQREQMLQNAMQTPPPAPPA